MTKTIEPATMSTIGGAIILPSMKWLNSPTSANTKAPAAMIPIPDIWKIHLLYISVSFLLSPRSSRLQRLHREIKNCVDDGTVVEKTIEVQSGAYRRVSSCAYAKVSRSFSEKWIENRALHIRIQTRRIRLQRGPRERDFSLMRHFEGAARVSEPKRSIRLTLSTHREHQVEDEEDVLDDVHPAGLHGAELSVRTVRLTLQFTSEQETRDLKRRGA